MVYLYIPTTGICIYTAGDLIYTFYQSSTLYTVDQKGKKTKT